MSVLLSHVRIQRAHGAEHQLVARQAVPQGDLLLVESPLLAVPVGHHVWGTYTWQFVDALLSDRRMLKQYDHWKLLSTPVLQDPEDLTIESTLMAKHRLSRQRVKSLYFSVCTNNIGLLDDDQMRVRGYGLFEVLSRADHSCAPNARLQAVDVDRQTMALAARRDVKAGEPVTWSYFRETEFLGSDFEARNLGLVNTFRFACRCERCRVERPPGLAHVPDLLGYFDAQIQAHARELAASPRALAEACANSPMEQHRRALREAPAG